MSARRGRLGSGTGPEHLSDFTTTLRVVPIAALAILVGFAATGVAFALLRLIALFTNVFYFHRWSVAAASPADHTLGVWAVLVPVVGALIIGAMARWGSERIRGHGIPEALEAILIGGSRISPKVAILKPLSSAISIGSGGPFGAEGPIIMTGGAVGSIAGQLFTLSRVERKVLLVAGAAAGMSATFATPVAAILLAVELLLFEWKPRSFVPVALASAAAAALRHVVFEPGPLVPAAAQSDFVGGRALACCALAGLFAGALSILMTQAVYRSEDLFQRLPLHWMWWPAFGGLAIGLGGLLCPRALGVGFETIGDLVHERLAVHVLLVLALVKLGIWAISLGSGTSGGVLAPLLMLGGALGALEAHWFPGASLGFWPLISMGAVVGGTMRSPLTGVVFAVELTHDMNLLLPLVIAVTVAHALTVLASPRSILTEKLVRRGLHVSREYEIGSFDTLVAADVMNRVPVVLAAAATLAATQARFERARGERAQHLYPVVDADARLVGAITHERLVELAADERNLSRELSTLAEPAPPTVFGNQPLHTVVKLMAEQGRTRVLVVDAADPTRLLGKVALHDLLAARAGQLGEELRRERVLSPWRAVGRWLARSRPVDSVARDSSGR